jgi:hypothetical protein
MLAIKPSGANLTFESRLTSGVISNVKFRSSTRNIDLLVILVTPTFALSMVSDGCKCRSRTTRADLVRRQRRSDARSAKPLHDHRLGGATAPASGSRDIAN